MQLVILLGLVALATARPDDDYSRYENFDLDELADNIRLLGAYGKCFIGTGKCTAEGSDIKKLIPEAVQTSCGKCSDKQKKLVARVCKLMTEKLPEDWKSLNKMHNPDGKFDESIKKFINQYGG